MRQQVDNVNGGFAASLILATIAGWGIQEWAAFAALVYSLLLIMDKLGLLGPTRGVVARITGWCWRQIVAAARWVWSKVRRT